MDVRCSKHLSESFQRAVGILAKRWTPLILYVLSAQPRRFNEIAEQIQFVSDRMLSERLKELEAEGLIIRRIYAEVPVRVEYSLTDKGCDLQPVFMAIGTWASKWLETGAAGACSETPDEAPDETPDETPGAGDRPGAATGGGGRVGQLVGAGR
jgi:DNA-binding HxlR family transcriptional regulator